MVVSSSGSGTNPLDGGFGADALRYAVALSRASNHPISRAMVEALDGRADISVTRSATLSATCGEAVLVRFGSLEYIKQALPKGGVLAGQLDREVARQHRWVA